MSSANPSPSRSGASPFPSSVVPVPSCPEPPSPQQTVVASVKVAQAVWELSDSETAVLSGPKSMNGSESPVSPASLPK